MTEPDAKRVALQLEHLAWTWRQGAPVRVGELQRLLDQVRAVAERTGSAELLGMTTRIELLIQAVHVARGRAESELAAIPARRRAMRAHAVRFDPAVGVHLRRGA